MAAHSQTPPKSVGPVPLEGISGAMLSRWLHTPRHLQRVWDQFVRKESPEQCRPDGCTLPDTLRECGTSSSGRNLQSNLVQMAAHSQTPPESVGPVRPEGISGAILSEQLHTPSHLQRVWDQFIWKESPEQSRLDGCTLPDTSRECGTSLSRRNLWSNVIWTAAHSQTRPESVGPVHPEGISRAILSGQLHTPRHLQRVWDQFVQKESPEQCRPDGCTLPDTSRECGTSSSRRNLWSNVVWMAAHSQTPPESVGPVCPEGISGAISSGRLHTPRHLQRVWDQFVQKESLEQCHLDSCTLPDTSRECGTSSSRRNLQSNLVQMAARSDTSRECGTSSSGRNLRSNVVWMAACSDTSRECGTSSSGRNLRSNLVWIAAHSQTPPESVGQVPPEGISGAMSSRWLHTPRHLQRVWDQFPQKESPEQSHPDGCTLPDTSRECGTSSSRRNLQSNLVQTAAHSQTPPESVGPVPPEGISRAILSRQLHTPRHLQRVWDQFLQKESPEQCCPDGCTLPDTSKECGTSSSRRNLQSNLIWMAAHSQTPPKSVGPVPPEGISRAISSGWLHTPRHLQRVWDQFLRKESPEQSHPDGYTLLDTSRECGTSSSGRNLQSNLVWMAAHSQTPPKSVGPVPLEGISRAISSGCLHTPRHLQRVWDQFLWKESPEQSCPDVCTLPDTSKECGTSSSRRNLRSNLIRTSAHSQTPSKGVGPVPLEGICRAILSGCLYTP